MKRIIAFSLLLLPLTALSQNHFAYMSEASSFMKDVNGQPLMLKTNYELDGSPYYSNDYCIANIKVILGKKYGGLQVKLNLEDNRVIYKLADGKEWEANVQIESIEFSGCNEKAIPVTFRSGFPAVDKQTHLSYYQVLDSGVVQLLKFMKVSFTDQRPYNGPNIVRKYASFPVYYAYTPGKGMTALGKGNEYILQALADKKNLVDKFIDEHNIRFKKEEDLVRLFNYYNTSSK